MKTIYKKLLFLFLLLPFSILAQSTLDGVVTDSKTKQPLPGVNVNVQGASKGTSSDFDGKFKLTELKKGDKVVFSFIGYDSQTVNYSGQQTISIVLTESANQLQEVVVQVGYGTVKKKDATGAATTLTAKDFNKGAILSADQLLIGKVAGVRVTTDGGAPDSNPNIIIRGIGSISAQTSPLIVIDNVPLDNNLAAGQGNPLSLINPNDIETFTILKDASATAIYGSRASNGVILITTKKGTSGKPQYNYSTTFSFGKVDKYVDVMDGPTFANYVNSRYGATGSTPNLTYINYLGAQDPNYPNDPSKRILYNTNWQDAIYRPTTTQDHNFSVRAPIFGNVPFRASVGYNQTEGVVKTNDYSRISASIKLTPTFLNNHLKVDINAKGLSSQKNNIDAGGAIGAALNMDPTKPIYDNSPNNRFGGYYQDLLTKDPVTGAPLPFYSISGSSNPVEKLMHNYNPQSIDKLLGNIELDYKTHFLPDLHVVLNFGMETSQSKIRSIASDNSISTYGHNTADSNPLTNYVFSPGYTYQENQTRMNQTADQYLLYTKKLSGFISRFEGQVGHSFQSFVNVGDKTTYRPNNTTGLYEQYSDPLNLYYNKNTIESYFARTNFDLKDKYLFTLTFRADGSSLFAPDKRWGYFPAGGFAWKVKEESFLKDSKIVQDLKIRLGYGATGNSNITGTIAGFYPYTPNFAPVSSTGQYLPGINQVYVANPFSNQLTWEKSTTINAAIDYSLFGKGIVTGTIDAYYRKTTDLLAPVNFPTGQFLSNVYIKNAAAISNKGIETSLTVKVISSQDMNWSVSGNLTYNIGNVDSVDGTPRIQVGFIPGIGNPLTYHAPGQEPNSFWVYQQAYDTAGKPIPNVFVDRNGDGKIDEQDRYYAPVAPHWTLGFSTSFNYKNFDFNASFRGQIGGKVYNSVKYQYGWADHVTPNQSANFNNVLNIDFPFANYTGTGYIPFSDYYLESASFLRCENLTVGYKFDKLFKSTSLRLYVGANNLFILTKYSGQDPENYSGIDTNFYPRPKIYNIGLNFDF